MPLPPPPNPTLAELAAVLGEDQAREVVRTFLKNFPPLLQELRLGDRERGRRAAHSLKSSARQMGALALSQRMTALEERLARPGETIAVTDLAEVARDFSAAAGPLRLFAGA
jgi:HPt (histidine-containing phosphotransfer) domain-containing protein